MNLYIATLTMLHNNIVLSRFRICFFLVLILNIHNALGKSFYIYDDLSYDMSFYKYFTDYIKPEIIEPIIQEIENIQQEYVGLNREINKKSFNAQSRMLLNNPLDAEIQESNIKNTKDGLEVVQQEVATLEKHRENFYPNWRIHNQFKYHIEDKLDSEVDFGFIGFKNATETKTNFYVNCNFIYSIHSAHNVKSFVLVGAGLTPSVEPYFNLGSILIVDNSLYEHQLNISALYRHFFYHQDINNKITLSIKNSFEIFRSLYLISNEIFENKSENLLVHSDLLHSTLGFEYHGNSHLKFYVGYNATYSFSKTHLIIESFCFECTAHM